MSRRIPVLLAWLLCGALIVTPQSAHPDDPFADLSQLHDRAEAEWQEARRDLDRRLAILNPCSDEYGKAIAEVQALMRASFSAKRAYLSQWQDLMQRRYSAGERDRMAVPTQLAKLQKEVERARAISADAKRRRAALIAAGRPTNSQEVIAVDGLIDTTTQEEKEYEVYAKQLGAERDDLAGKSGQTLALAKGIAKRIDNSRREERQWVFLYKVTTNSGRLACKDAPR